MRLPTVLIIPILLAATWPVVAGDDPNLAADECRGAFNLLVPGDLVRAQGHLTLATHYVDAANHLRFDLRPTSLAIGEVRDGQTTELGSTSFPWLANGAEVLLRLGSGGIAVSLGPVTIMRVAADLPDGSRWGVLSPAGVALDEIIFQPTGDVVLSDDFMRTPGEPSVWEDMRGQWRLAALESSRYSANAFTLVGRADDRATALTAAGYWFWEDCTVEASVRPSEDARGFGVGLGLHDADDFHLARFTPSDGADGTLQIVRVRDGVEETLASVAARAHPDEWHRLSLSGVGERLAASLDGAELLVADDPTLAPGRVLLWVAGEAPVAFDDVEVYAGARRDHRPTVLSHALQSADPVAAPFINDRYMTEWADERDQWRSGGGGVWHSGYFWGDVALAWQADSRGLKSDAALHICVPVDGPAGEPPSDLATGYHLTVKPAGEGLALTLLRGEQSVGEASMALPTNPVQIALRRTGALVEGLVAGEVVASFTDEAPLPGGKVGLVCRGARSQPARLQVTSANVLDSTFRAAPTDWHTAGGGWRVASRWACTPRWAWFQGRDDHLASIWTRRVLRGDFVVEFFAGLSMDQPWAPFYQHPGNICVTLCGQDATPGSGYSFVLAGWGNSASGLFRRDELVAQTSKFTMPDILDSLGGGASREDAHKLHNEWWHIRVERFGSTLRVFVDGKLAVTFEDPDPLPDGAVGIWTLDNGMSVARARVYYEAASIPALAPEPEASVTPAAPVKFTVAQPPHYAQAFENGPGGWGPASPGSCEVALAERDDRAGKRCLAISNPVAGGDFALRAPISDVDLATRPLLSFDCAIPEGVMLDAFAVIDGQRYRLRLTGPDEPPSGIEDIGSVSDARADGRWRRATVDLLEMLRPFFVPEAAIKLDELQFAAHAVPEYARAGIGANPAGATWHLDNVLLGAPVPGPVRVDLPRGARLRVQGGRVARGSSLQVSPSRDGIALIVAEDGRALSIDLIAFGQSSPQVTPAIPEPPRPTESLLDADFETDAGPLRPWGVDAAIELRRVRGPTAGNPDGGQWCLQARCARLGGLYGLDLGCAPFEASRYPTLTFDYRVPDSLRVGLLVDVAGERRTIRFTDNDATWPTIGRIAAVADGQWHTATVDLHALLGKAFPKRASLPVTAIAFATSGWPGNRADTYLWLDNVKLSPAPDSGDDAITPVISAPTPADGEAACARHIGATVTDEGSGVSPADLRLWVAGRLYTIADGSLDFDEASGALGWDAPAGVELGGDGDAVECRLQASDLAGNAAAELAWTWRLGYSLDADPPDAPVASYLPARTMADDDFEASVGYWGNFVAAQVLRRAAGGAAGPGCIELRSLGGRSANGFALAADFGAKWREFPVVRFNYRLEDARSATVRLFGTTFNGSRDLWTDLGAFPLRDGQWHTARVDIPAALAKADPSLDIHRLFLSIEMPGPDAAVIVDDWAMYSQAASSAAFRWSRPADASGVLGYSWLLDDADDTVPPETIRGSDQSVEFRDLSPGHHCFHVRACDGAGNWGPASHVPFDLTPAQ